MPLAALEGALLSTRGYVLDITDGTRFKIGVIKRDSRSQVMELASITPGKRGEAMVDALIEPQVGQEGWMHCMIRHRGRAT